MIGHLQSNKVKKLLTVPNLHVIESIDSVKLANLVNETCGKLDKTQQVFVEVLTSDEGCSLLSEFSQNRDFPRQSKRIIRIHIEGVSETEAGRADDNGQAPRQTFIRRTVLLDFLVHEKHAGRTGEEVLARQP